MTLPPGAGLTIVDGIPWCEPVAGHVYLTATDSAFLVLVAEPADPWWLPLTARPVDGVRELFGCGLAELRELENGEVVLLVQLRRRLLDSVTWPEALEGVLNREQWLELSDIVYASADATTVGPFLSAIETGRCPG